MNIIDEIKASFDFGSNLVKLIYINLGVFTLALIIELFAFLFQIGNVESFILNIFAVPTDFATLVVRPWTIISYMFLHVNFLHILFNMLWLYWFGSIFLKFLTEKQLLTVYLLGGIFGAAFYIAAFNLFPVFAEVKAISNNRGASASVMAIVVAATVIAPNYQVYLPFLNQVKIKYIAIVFIALDLIQIPLSNSGGHIAHIGGMVLGFIYVRNFQQGKDIGRNFDILLGKFFSLFKKRKNMKVSYKRPTSDKEYNSQRAKRQEKIDVVLDKIAKSGYDSLTKEEKDLLFKMSNNK